MNVLILILIVLLLIGVSGICSAVYVHFLIKNSDDWMDNSEYDYGHDVHYEQDDEQF